MIRIVAAAVQSDGLIFSMPQPARHNDILRHMSQKLGLMDVAIEATQGFLGDNGKFYGRAIAKQIVIDFKQPTIASHNEHELFSEDLW